MVIWASRQGFVRRCGRWGAAWVVFAGLGVQCLGAEKPVAIPLAELGLQAPGGRPGGAGSTQVTVDYVGDHHLLVTFPVRRLMTRLADDDPNDVDRTIDALLVDLPSGKVAARTSWRIHDAGQYLWNLGRGRFLLRVKDRLTVFAPLANLSTEEPFNERELLNFDRRVIAVVVSAESDLLTVETIDKPAPQVKPVSGLQKRTTAGLVEIAFYRLQPEVKGAFVSVAGRLYSRDAVEIPMTGEGYLDIGQESKTRWVFDYVAHAGKKTELSPFETSCFPRAKFVSRAEFVAIGCRGSVDKLEIGGFNMKGEEMWQQNLFGSFVRSTFSFAPESGRFALGRSMLSVPMSSLGPDSQVDASLLTGQDVQVLQTHSGKQVFHTVLTPTQLGGQNFSLSPDGTQLAVVRGGAIEINRLPEASAKEREEAKSEREVPLEKAEGEILLPSRSRTEVPTAPASAAAAQGDDYYVLPKTVPTPVATPAPPPAPRAPVENTVVNGDIPADGPRKAPSLYGPDEAGAGKGKPEDSGAPPK